MKITKTINTTIVTVATIVQTEKNTAKYALNIEEFVKMANVEQ